MVVAVVEAGVGPEEVVAMSESDVYCDLVICSNSQTDLPSHLFLAKSRSRIVFTDNLSPDRVAQRNRWKKAGIPMRPTIERYWWELSSQGRVESDDLENHVIWLLSHLRSKKILKDELIEGYRCYLSVFWGASTGTGGGPVISVSLAKLLVQHGLRVDVGFYVKE